MAVDQQGVDNARQRLDKGIGQKTDSIEWRMNGCPAPTNDFTEVSPMAIIAIFLLGIGNFALQRAVLESGHPMIARMPPVLLRSGGRWLQAIEFLILLVALFLAAKGMSSIALAYGLYSAANGLCVWLIVKGHV